MSEEIYEDKVEIKRHIKYFERCLQVCNNPMPVLLASMSMILILFSFHFIRFSLASMHL